MEQDTAEVTSGPPAPAKHPQLGHLLASLGLLATGGLAIFSLAGLPLGLLVLTYWCWHSVGELGEPTRRLQTQTLVAEAEDLLDKVFSRPPSSLQERGATAYICMGAVFFGCVVLLMAGFNLDQLARRRRLERAIVPQELGIYHVWCFQSLGPKESVPCEIAEQHYLDRRLVRLRSPQGVAGRRRRMNFCGFLLRFSAEFGEALTRKHLLLSFFLRTLPVFTCVKRAFLLVVELSLCMLAAAVAVNLREHTAPLGRYEVLLCDGGIVQTDCLATVPCAVICAAVLGPVFDLLAVRPMRQSCFVTQTHPSTSRVPLGHRKHGTIRPRSLCDRICCRRSQDTRHNDRTDRSRQCMRRCVRAVWRTTRPSYHSLHFRRVWTSWLLICPMVLVILGTVAYLSEISTFLSDQVVYHWLAWTLTMFCSTALLIDPILIFWKDVLWCSLALSLSQRWGFGPHALASTTRYQPVVRHVEDGILTDIRTAAATRIQRWWLIYQAIHEYTARVVKVKPTRKDLHPKKKHMKDSRKWCLKIDVLYCSNLRQNSAGTAEPLSPVVRLMCDTGNPKVLQTTGARPNGSSVAINETFFADIKDSQAMYVTVSEQGSASEEFVGRGYFEFKDLRRAAELPDGHLFQVPLYDIQHGERMARAPSSHNGLVELRALFLDPLREPCAPEGTDWMLPKNRVKIMLSGGAGPGSMLGDVSRGSTAKQRGSTLGSQRFSQRFMATGTTGSADDAAEILEVGSLASSPRTVHAALRALQHTPYNGNRASRVSWLAMAEQSVPGTVPEQSASGGL